jgi:hypothetical protein
MRGVKTQSGSEIRYGPNARRGQQCGLGLRYQLTWSGTTMEAFTLPKRPFEPQGGSVLLCHYRESLHLSKTL